MPLGNDLTGRAGRITEVEVVGGKDSDGNMNTGYAIDAKVTGLIGSQAIVVFASAITDQATLDAMAQAVINGQAAFIPPALIASGLTAQIQIEVKDRNPVRSFNPEDQIIVVSPTLGLSGAYYVKRIQRSFTDPNWATIDLVTRATEQWMLDEHIRAAAKDLASQVTT